MKDKTFDFLLKKADKRNYDLISYGYTICSKQFESDKEAIDYYKCYVSSFGGSSLVIDDDIEQIPTYNEYFS